MRPAMEGTVQISAQDEARLFPFDLADLRIIEGISLQPSGMLD